jgi:hypothetical protein
MTYVRSKEIGFDTKATAIETKKTAKIIGRARSNISALSYDLTSDDFGVGEAMLKKEGHLYASGLKQKYTSLKNGE